MMTIADALRHLGYDEVDEVTTDRMLRDVQKAIRADLFGFLATGTGEANEEAEE